MYILPLLGTTLASLIFSIENAVHLRRRTDQPFDDSAVIYQLAQIILYGLVARDEMDFDYSHVGNVVFKKVCYASTYAFGDACEVSLCRSSDRKIEDLAGTWFLHTVSHYRLQENDHVRVKEASHYKFSVIASRAQYMVGPDIFVRHNRNKNGVTIRESGKRTILTNSDNDYES